MASHLSGPLLIGNGANVPIPLGFVTGTIAVASGTLQRAWATVLPNVALTLREVTVGFVHGATAPPRGGTLRFKIWSNGVSKGLIATSVAGATYPSVAFGTLSATFPARARFDMSIHTVGATGAGRGPQPTLYFSHTLP